MKVRAIDRICAVLAVLLIPILFLSAAALIPCLFRPFYYVSMDLLQIPETSGYSPEVVREAYDDVMDYIWTGGPFRAGQLSFSPEGEAHFADCVPLFRLQPALFLGALALLVAYLILRRRNLLQSVPIAGQSLFTAGGALTLFLMAIVGIFAIIDFDALFTLFHKVFFPGKSNWLFDPATDEMIKILPESFFALCAGFIVAAAAILSIVAILVGRKRSR